MLRICKHHGEVKFLKNGKDSWYCTVCHAIRRDKIRAENKQKAIEYKGGACGACGYSYCVAALEFHHEDPTVKEASISHMRNSSWDKIKAELDKTVLLCSNCHRELHWLLDGNRNTLIA